MNAKDSEVKSDSPSQASAPSSVRASSRKNRVYVLRSFIKEVYGNYLKPGSIVLDVAGGKGDLSWLLQNVDGVKPVILDPRITKHGHIVRSIAFLRKNPKEAKIRAIPGRQTHQPLAELLPLIEDKERFTEPKHMRILVDEDLVTAVRNFRQTEDGKEWTNYWTKSCEKGAAVQPLGYMETHQESEGYITEATEALGMILNADLIVGFHPDQATDSCFELSNELQIPVCVVPCCVFPKLFPNRRLRNGLFVRKYDGLIPYFMEKYPGLRLSHLQFHETETARNIALYSLPGESIAKDCHLICLAATE